MQSLMYAVNRQCLTLFSTFYSIAAHLPLLITYLGVKKKESTGDCEWEVDGRVEEQASVYHSISQMVFAQLKSI